MARVGLSLVAMLLCTVTVGRVDAAPGMERCVAGITSASPTFIAAAEQLVRQCTGAQSTGSARSDCAADAVAELESNRTTTGYGGRLRKERDRFRQRVMRACAGKDGRVDTADDVTPASLDRGAHNGFRFRPWGAELASTTEPRLLARLANQPQSTAQMQSIIEEDCATTEPVDVWMAKPGLRRLVDTYECLVTHEILSRLKGKSGSLAPAIQLVKLDFTRPPVIYDAGADRLPLDAPDGVNDRIAIPATSACPLPGVGVCAGKQDVICSLAPGSGRDPASSDCGDANPCREGLLGPDGVTAADTPRGILGDGRFFYKLTENGNGAEVEYVCLVEGIRDHAGALVTTDFSGTCNAGPRVKAPCKSNADCDSELPPRYWCLNGDEYFCHINEIVGSNADANPPCAAPCLAAEMFGPAGTGCGTGGEAFCVLGTCSGGTRHGQGCDEGGNLTCPGGTCVGLGDELRLTGDEAGFFCPKFAGVAYMLCPFQYRHDAAMDLLNGNGWVTSTITGAPSLVCRPPGVSAQLQNAYVHEPSPGTGNEVALVGFYTGGSLAKSGEIPCPDISVPFPAATTGIPTRTAIGPIIGVSGALMP